MSKILPLLVLFLLLTSCTPASLEPVVPNDVYYVGPDGGVKTALTLAGYSLVNNPSQADVILLNGEIPDVAEISRQLNTGAGLVLIMGEDITQESVQGLLVFPVAIKNEGGAQSLVDIPDAGDPISDQIVWNSAPQVRERSQINGLDAAAKILIRGYTDHQGMLWKGLPKSIGGIGERAFILTPWLSDQANSQMQEWGYFNYLIYQLVERAAGDEPMDFALYPASSVPHKDDQFTLLVFLAVELVLFFGAFIIIRRYSHKHPEALDSIISDSRKFKANEASTDWEKVGFHRPLSGLLVGMGIGILLFIPLIIYQNLILPQFILPSAQALGMWGRVTQLFLLTWTIFDMGTSAAAMKYLSQYRVSDPQRGFKYIQVYLWWQALSGAIQVAIVVMVTSLGIVHTPYALLAWSIVIHTLIQIPGFYGVFRTTLNGLQRNDYARYIDAAGTLVLPILTQLALVPIFYAWGKANPATGASMGGVIGLGTAAYAIELLNFLLGMWLYRRLGYKAGILFMAHFDWKIIKETFRFGFFEMLGGLLVAAGGFLEIWVTQQGLVNYSETWGNWILAYNFLLAFTVSTNLFDGVMPAISEALSSGYKKLSQYYSAQSYKWGAISSAVLGAMLLVVAPKFIIGSSGEEFQRAAILAVPLMIFGSIQFFGWLGDAIFLGSNRPVLRAVMILLEQVIRVGLLVILLSRFQIEALVIGCFVGILVRGAVAYFVADKYCFPQKIYFWQTLSAPLLAGGAHYLFLSLVAKIIWQGDEITSVVLFFIGLIPAMPVFFFFYALAGGWDDAGLEEVTEASQMTGFLRPVVKVIFEIPSRWGAKISPLHNRFPIKIRELAMMEAQALTESRVKLVEG